MQYRIVTPDSATDYDNGIAATVKHCKNVALNITSLLMRTFEDALPDDVVQSPEIIDNYVANDRPGSRHTFTTGAPLTIPHEETPPWVASGSPAEWRTRAFYYALGQVESLWELSPLVQGDAVSFSYHFQWFVEEGGEASLLTLRNEWVIWEAGRRANLEQHGRPQVAAIRQGPPQPNVDYLEGGEHDPNLGNEASRWDDGQ